MGNQGLVRAVKYVIHRANSSLAVAREHCDELWVHLRYARTPPGSVFPPEPLKYQLVECYESVTLLL